MNQKPLTLEGYNLFHDGALAFADIENTGIRVDVPYLEEQYTRLSKDILSLQEKENALEDAKKWRQVFGKKTNFTSNTQLSRMLFSEWGYKATKQTHKGSNAVDDSVLRKIDNPFVNLILQERKLLKVRDTYVKGLLREQTDGLLHPSFNLHFVASYRSSSDGPNFQNQPIRDPEMGGIIRTAFLPLESDHCFGEMDYKGIEVSSNVCYNKDPALVKYVSDPKLDMHRDMAGECFILEHSEIGKKIRYVGKNGFTFPEFYGSYFKRVAPAMWTAIDENHLRTESGIPLKEHLKSKGIKNLAQFTQHIQEVEDNFWTNKFPVYAQWKKDWYASYLEQGYINLLTGFRCSGPMRRNEVTNYPGQGTAFHFLLWGCIQMHRWLTVNEMSTKIIGQIHDSLVFSFHKAEIDKVLRKAQQVMCIDIRKHWKWINVPLIIEAEVAPCGRPWGEKKPYEIKGVA